MPSEATRRERKDLKLIDNDRAYDVPRERLWALERKGWLGITTRGRVYLTGSGKAQIQ